MGTPFLQQFYRDVDRNLNDASASKRYPLSDRYEDLTDIDRELFDEAIKVTSFQTMLGYAEAVISLIEGESFYLFPEGFRTFYQLEHRTGDNRVDGVYRTKQFFQNDSPGVEILTAHRGFRLDPAPTSSGDWTLIYAKAPGRIHYATASHVSAKGLISGIPVISTTEHAGDLITLPNYYAAMELRIVSADVGAEQVREILASSVVGEKVSLQLRHAFNPVPTGTVVYEVRPTLPPEYDSLYAMDAAMLQLDRRDRPAKVAFLSRQRSKKWVGVRSYLMSTTVDRDSKRHKPIDHDNVASRLGVYS